MIHKLKKVLVLIWCALIILVSSGCGNSSVKVKENNLDIEKIYIFNGDNYEEVYPMISLLNYQMELISCY